ncbi:MULTISPECIES: glycerophosphodiester phosphodiesterase family protein [unclassified Chelatococcus]|uniref:glycerophosphodiester phosphodiesterase family protein n=1 Tax=unclassified Chelatococcus TaxID=2638111 RepID=UPI001BCEDB08|nr:MULTISPECIES: glycerophosphodiester phosphodiesterase family protein [unclassified Chelatococcus]MBS7698723.1 hypothetical protein [Chelatococcus sp. YT9]MBX3554695.1 hypothetical protein [Chelatococcus sp.]
MTEIASHRGGAQCWPENSRLAFRQSAVLPVEFVEFDIHRSRDGVLVVHHDAKLGRTAEGTGAIADMDWDALKQVRLVGTDEETIPTFTEVLDILAQSPLKLRIELKNRADGSRYPGLEAEVVAVLAARSLMERTTFTSFDLDTLRDLAVAAPGRPLIFLVKESYFATHGRDVRALARKARAAGIGEIALRASQMQDDDLAICAEEGVRFGVFAAHDEPAISRAFAAGVSAFTTDRPDLAIALRP